MIERKGTKILMISYEKLWRLMEEKGITQYRLIYTYGINPGQLYRLKQNRYVSTYTVEKFCRILDCRPEDIIEFVQE